MEAGPEKSFEEQWAEAFRDASVTPPEECWDNIEKALEKEKKKRPFIILWNNKGLVSSIAAMVLLTLGILFFVKTEQPFKGKTAAVSAKQEGNQTSAPTKSSEGITEAQPDTDQTTGSSLPGSSLLTDQKTADRKYIVKSRFPSVSSPALIVPAIAERTPSSENLPQNVIPAEDQRRQFGTGLTSINAPEPEPFATGIITHRAKLAYDLPQTTEVIAKNDAKTFWMGLNSGVSPFDPNYSARGFERNASMAAQNVADGYYTYKTAGPAGSTGLNNTIGAEFSKTSSLPNNVIQNGRAINFGLTMGKKLNKKLGLESGFRFMRANSGLQTNVYSVNSETGEIQAYFQSNYLNSKQSNLSNAVISSSEDGNQAYDYFSVPLQLSYEIPLMKKLDLEILGGVSGDLFVRSVLTGINSGTNVLTASNSTFKPVSLSGLGGLRLNYTVGKNWEAVLGSFYQHSISSGLRPAYGLSFRPKMFGINYGLNYRLR